MLPGKLVAIVVLKIAAVTFVVGNVTAFLMGAWPIRFALVPYSDQEATAMADLRTGLASDRPEAVTSLALLQFLHNDLDEARRSIDSAASPRDGVLDALDAALRVKEAGRALDLAFGQFKLARIRRALGDLDRLSTENPDDVLIQVLALATFSSVHGIDDFQGKALPIAARLEPALKTPGVPVDLAASGWLALARTFANEAEAVEAGERPAWTARAAAALASFDGLEGKSAWLDAERPAKLARGAE
ncbi:MAG: hypothetical protein LBP86_03970 [Azoarcus sp.]|jgi:hypothetical protein|nr:hypothetical protein [Azoarcus sp.]